MGKINYTTDEINDILAKFIKKNQYSHVLNQGFPVNTVCRGHIRLNSYPGFVYQQSTKLTKSIRVCLPLKNRISLKGLRNEIEDLYYEDMKAEIIGDEVVISDISMHPVLYLVVLCHERCNGYVTRVNHADGTFEFKPVPKDNVKRLEETLPASLLIDRLKDYKLSNQSKTWFKMSYDEVLEIIRSLLRKKYYIERFSKSGRSIKYQHKKGYPHKVWKWRNLKHKRGGMDAVMALSYRSKHIRFRRSVRYKWTYMYVVYAYEPLLPVLFSENPPFLKGKRKE